MFEMKEEMKSLELPPGIPANYFRAMDADSGKNPESQSGKKLPDKKSKGTPGTECSGGFGRAFVA